MYALSRRIKIFSEKRLGARVKILVFGIGYVGTVSGTLLSRLGNEVLMIDVNKDKVDILNRGESPIFEPELGAIIGAQVSKGLLNSKHEPPDDLNDFDAALICVGTPTASNSENLDLSAIQKVVESIALRIKLRETPILIAVCSTVPPGTTNGLLRRILQSNNVSEKNYVLGFLPEFLREGTAVKDFIDPTRFIIGTNNISEAELFTALRPDLKNQIHITSVETAEMLKVVENAFHALKITFANEIGRLCRSLDINSKDVMKLLSLDTRQNISSKYLIPGFAFGGSCLPKDLRSIQHIAKAREVSTPVLSAILLSNQFQIKEGLERIIGSNFRKIGLLGLAFKANTDDLRESPALEVVEKLSLEGFEVVIHDFSVDPTSLVGSNLLKWQIFKKLGVSFTNQLSDITRNCELIVILQHNKFYFENELIAQFPNVLDLTNHLNREK